MLNTVLSGKMSLIFVAILPVFLFFGCSQPVDYNSSVKANNPETLITAPSNNTNLNAAVGAGNRYTFYVLYRQNDQLSEEMKQVTSLAQKSLSASADFVYLDTADESSKTLMKKYNISNVPLPVTMVTAPDGARICVFPEKVSLTQLNNSLTSPASAPTPWSTVITVNSAQEQTPSETASSAVNVTPESAILSETSGKILDRVDVVYFHQTQRCAKCLCFEERITHVVSTDFKNQLDNGKLTYQVVDLGNKASKEIAMQYKAVGSQMFVNNVVNGTDNIEDILGIWNWNCTGDKDGFDLKIKNIIESKLKGKS